MEPQPLPGWTLRAHRSPVRALGFAPDGLTCASGDDEGWVVWWSLETRRPLAIWHAHDNALLTTEFWTQNEIVTHARDNKLRIWRLDRAQAYNVQPLGLGAEAPRNAVQAGEQSGEQADDQSGTHAGGAQPHHGHAGESSDAGALRTAPAAPPPAAAGGPPTFYPKPWLVHAMDVNALNFCAAGLSPESSQLAVPATTASERIDVYQLGEGLALTRPHRALNGADALPIATVLSDEAAQTQRRGELGTVMALLFFDPKTLVAGYESGHLVVFNLDTGSAAWTVRPHRVPVLSLAAYGSTVWSAAADKTIGATDMLGRTTEPAVRLDHKGIAAIDALPSERLAIAARWDGTMSIFRINGPTDLQELASFRGGRHAGVTCARAHLVDTHAAAAKRRLRPLPPAWIAAGGKDGRVGLFGVPKELTLGTLQRSDDSA